MNSIIKYPYNIETNNFISKNKEKYLDLRLKNPFEELSSIPIDAKSAFNKNEKFIEQVKKQDFLVFLYETNKYFSGEDLKVSEIKNPLIISKLKEDDINFKIFKEKSGISLIEKDIKN